jgi:subtilisin family serine protease
MNLRPAVLLCAACVAGAAPSSAPTRHAPDAAARADRTVVVGYDDRRALDALVLRTGARVARDLRALRVLTVVPRDRASFGAAAATLPGVRFVSRAQVRVRAAEPGLAVAPVRGGAFEWQFGAIRGDAVPAAVLRAASAVTIAVVDSGADLTAPDLAAKSPSAFDVRSSTDDVRDTVGHGTFVASLAAGSVTNGDGIAGFGGDAGLLVVKATSRGSTISDVDAAAAIVHAVDNGARVVNLSFGGPVGSPVERRAVDYAVARDVLLVAAAGNDYLDGNPVHYPAALLQPVGSRGRGGRGLVVGASTLAGTRASFSGAGTHLSLVAPGERVLGAISALAPRAAFPPTVLPGSTAGLYGYGSGTSYAAPQVAGAAALVWAANPALRAADVAQILKATASGAGRWSPEVGYGVVDVASAVAQAGGGTPVELSATREGRTVRLSWRSAGAVSYRVTVGVGDRPATTLYASTAEQVATYAAAAGRTYAFAVTALDAAGAPIGASPRVRVRVAR